MDLETQIQPEVSVTPPVETAPQGASEADSNPELTEAAPAWTPDFKLKVMDKEFEIDEFYRPLVKDEDTLKRVKRMQEQILGLPHIEAAREEFKSKYNQVLPRVKEYEVVESKLNRLSAYLQKNDFDSFFSDLQIPQEMVHKWLQQKQSEQSLDPQVRQRLEEARLQERKAYDLSQEVERYRQQEQQAVLQQSYMQVDQAIQSLAPDISVQFNDRMQNPDAFKNAVINKGVAIQQQYINAGRSAKPQLYEVIESVKQVLARVMGIHEAPLSPAQSGKPAEVPVIPIIKSGSASPIKTGPKSIADLKKLAASMD
jgi:hypothetical protein